MALVQPEVHRLCRALFVGHPGILQRAIDLLHADLQMKIVDEHGSASQLEKIISAPTSIACLPCGSDEALAAPAATIDERGGQAAYDALLTAVAGHWIGESTASLQHRCTKPPCGAPGTTIPVTPSCWRSCAARKISR